MSRKHIEKYRFLERIGKGGAGSVILSEIKETKEIVAIKAINKTKVPEKFYHRELEVCKILSGKKIPNVIDIYEVFEYKHYIFVVMEYTKRGDLYAYNVERNIPFGEHLISSILFQVVNGILELNELGILYRDLKCSNILVIPNEKNRNLVKICDFSHCVIGNPNDEGNKNIRERLLMKTQTGTLGYLSPEILGGKRYSVDEANVFPVGIVAHELFTKRHPSGAKRGTDLERRVISEGGYKRLNNIEHVSKVGQKFLKDVLVNKRKITKLKELLNHEFIVKHCGNKNRFQLKGKKLDFFENLEIKRTPRFLSKKEDRNKTTNDNEFFPPQNKKRKRKKQNRTVKKEKQEESLFDLDEKPRKRRKKKEIEEELDDEDVKTVFEVPKPKTKRRKRKFQELEDDDVETIYEVVIPKLQPPKKKRRVTPHPKMIEKDLQDSIL